jgi:prophage regulatory protein
MNHINTVNFDDLPASGFVRQSQLIPNVIPVSRETLALLVETKAFPAPIKISPRCKAWRVGDVREWLSNPVGST